MSLDKTVVEKINEVCYILWDFSIKNRVHISIETDIVLFRGIIFTMKMPSLDSEVNRVINMTCVQRLTPVIVYKMFNDMLKELKIRTENIQND